MTNTAYNMNTQNVYINTELINKCTHQQVITRGDIYYANIKGKTKTIFNAFGTDEPTAYVIGKFTYDEWK